MKNSKAKKSSTATVAKSGKAKGMKMKDLEPSGNVKGGYAFRTGGSTNSTNPGGNKPETDGYRMFGAWIN
jgi:hypothetical protein